MNNISTLIRAINAISPELGIINDLCKLPRLNNDPYINCYGANVLTYSPSYKEYSIKAGGCHHHWENAILSTIGEAVERYAATYYDQNESVYGTYNSLMNSSKDTLISIDQFSLFHEKQYSKGLRGLVKFTKETELTWFPTLDLTTNKKVWLPGQFIYLPFVKDKNMVTLNVSTGLAAHTDYHKAILTGLYEVIERDSFVLTWWQNISPPRIAISEEISSYIQKVFPSNYRWYFFDITYDLKVPTIMCLCYIRTECGEYPVISSATRYTYYEAIIKTIHEVAQSIPFHRILLERNHKKEYTDYSQIQSFEEHAWLYMTNNNMWHIFNNWISKAPWKNVDLSKPQYITDKDKLKSILSIFKKKLYNVLFKDITTPDLRQIGFYSIKIFIPQLLPLSGAYQYYFLGGKRLYEIPALLGYKINDFEKLNHYPHPFP